MYGYCYIRFTMDDKRVKIPTDYIKDYHKFVNDNIFVPPSSQEVVKVFWFEGFCDLSVEALPLINEAIEAHQSKTGKFYKAQVICYAETVDDLVNIISSKRPRIPNVGHVSESDSMDDVQKIRMDVHHKKKHEALLNEYMDSTLPKRTRPSEDLKQQLAAARAENEELKVAQKKEREAAQAEIAVLKKEVDTLRHLNLQWQNKILNSSTLLQGEHGAGAATASSNSKYEAVDGKVYLSATLAIAEDAWQQSIDQTYCSWFARHLAVAVFGSATLIKSSLTGRLPPGMSEEVNKARPALCPVKLEAMEEAFNYYRSLKKCLHSPAEERKQKFRENIRQKIQDLRYAAKSNKFYVDAKAAVFEEESD